MEIDGYSNQIPTRRVRVKNVTKGFEFFVKLDLSDTEIEATLAGGQLRFLKKQLKEIGVRVKDLTADGGENPCPSPSPASPTPPC